MQNIGADNAGDQFYRYKMPKLVAKVRLSNQIHRARTAGPAVLHSPQI